MGEPDRHRLPHDVVPTAYRLHLDTDLAGAVFTGTVEIDVDVRTPTDRVVCNAAGLAVGQIRVGTGEQSLPVTHELDEATERLIIALPEPVPAGPTTLVIAFSGTLNDELVGFYRSSFQLDGRTETMGVTQFEAPYARRAFPCWDEPEFKATFTISLTCDAGLLAVSNGAEVARTDVGDGRTRFDFATTMVMSTYLVAWVIGDLEVSASRPGGSTVVRVIHRPGQGHLVDFALDCATHAVAWFEDYYGIPYPGDKLDLVAVPDFAFGAMENLGCVTFRENLLLVDPERANRSEQERAATVIEHEIAHMWFGDLVTMVWWNGIWLNEAFATFMEFCCADAWRPEWEVWTSFGLSKSQAFDTDALAHTRPIEYEVRTPADAEGMFDILTYEKGGSVLRMFERYTGVDVFRDGVRRYLARHAYGNTDTADLWAALSEASATDVGSLMDTWILQGGHPRLEVATGDDGSLTLRQERFEFDGADPAEPATWIVPLRIEGSAGGVAFERTVLLDGPSTTVPIDAPLDWVNANAGFTGFYRTDYSPPLRAALLARVGDMSSLDRYALLDDGWALFLSAHLSPADVVSTIAAVAAVESEPSVWRRIAGVFGAMSGLVGPDRHDEVAALVRDLAGERLRSLLDSADDATARDLRAVLYRLVGTVGNDPEVIADARARFAASADGAPGDPDLGAAVLDVMAWHGGPADFDRVVAMFRGADTPQDELRALSALALFPGADEIRTLCEMCESEVRSQNAPYALAQAMANPRRGADVWRFVADRWDDLVARFPSSSIIRMVGGVRAFSEPALVAEVEAFFAEHEVPQAALTLQQHLERVRVNAATRRRIGPERLRDLPR